MLTATAPVLLLDYLRVPYSRPDSVPRAEANGSSPAGGEVSIRGERGSLTWPRSAGGATGEAAAYRLDGTPIFGRVRPDAARLPAQGKLGAGWEAVHAIYDAGGEQVASVWSDRDGNVYLPFDPDELILNLWSERYRAFAQTKTRSTFESVAKPAYYRARAILPTPMRLRLRRLYGRVSAPEFPRWPIETALDDLYVFLVRLLQELSGDPLPMLSLWPHGYSWSLVLTHDVERTTGYTALEGLREIEREAGYVSSWNFVPLRDYRVDADTLDRLRAEGCEIGVHGLRHDGRDLDEAQLSSRLPRMRAFAEEWQAVGFRSPSLLRDFAVIPMLGFEYDSSYPDTDPLQAQAGGCCSWLPFHNRDVVELPITLPQDHNLFELLGESDETLWREKASFLRARGGMALLLTHPDYMLEPERRRAYERLLGEYVADESVWKALPREVSDWWRRRAASSLVRPNGEWVVDGPAADDASVAFCRDVFGYAAAATDS